jgi:hypothetical protein
MINYIDIYDYVERKVNTEDRPVYCASRLEPVPKSFPACYITAMDTHAQSQHYTLAYDDEQEHFDMVVHVFTNEENGALYAANLIMDDVRAAFRKLYFKESFVGETANIDPTIVHLVGRFSRNIGGADQMPDD